MVQLGTGHSLAVALLCCICSCLGCASGAIREPNCQGTTASQLEARFLKRVVALKSSGKCDNYSDPADCPDYLALEIEFDRELEEFERCR